LSIADRSWQSQALAIVPTYNERENIEALVRALRAQPGDIHVLVVDDNSPDGTAALVQALAEADAGVHLLSRPGKLGLGSAYRAGFGYGLAHGYQYLCTMDADFSHDPASLPQLVDLAATGVDLVVGSRYVPGGRVVGSTRWRRFVSGGANGLARVFLGVHIRDCTAGFRCYRRRVLEPGAGVDLDAIFSNGYSFLIEMGYTIQRAGFTTGEVPITFTNRTLGASKISKNEIYKAFYTLLRLRTSSLPWERMVAAYRRSSGA
jgi:glycosyltransferase involved in cell wall biosynthesis